MDEIQHRIIHANGINVHIAEKGPLNGPLILFLHGFPELWYSWRHQILALSILGYRCVAPDLRGFGDTDAPEHPEAYTCMHVVGDLVALIDVLSSEEKVFVVGHDWGALMAWYLCLFRPDRIRALVNLSVVLGPRNPKIKVTDKLRSVYGDDYYMCRMQEPGDVEAEFAQLGTENVLKEIFRYTTPGPLFMPKGKWCKSSQGTALPPWLSGEDMKYYTDKFEKTGFGGGLNYYRNLDRNWELTVPWDGAQVSVPTKFIVGDLDLTYNSLGVKEYIHSGSFKRRVPFLQEVIVMKGVAHFINQEKPKEISEHIYDFFQRF